MPRKIPSYRQRKGYDQAIVTLTDSQSRQRRDYWLGTYETAESRERYHRIIAEWESLGRQLPPSIGSMAEASTGTTVMEIIHSFTSWASQHQHAMGGNMRVVLRLLNQLYGSTPAEAFGPRKLRMVRESMVRGDLSAKPPRRPWARTSVNKRIHQLVAVFKWASSHELIPVSVYESLRTVEPLKRGRTVAAETDPVRAVSLEQVEALRPFLSRPLRALVDLQLLTGARGGELFELRGRDIDRSDTVWTYSPDDHKTAHRGKSRTIYFGPKAQEVLQPFLDRPEDVCLFSPAEGAAERRQIRHANRKTPMSCGNVPGSNVTPHPRWYPHDHYTKDSYARAIARACAQAFPPPPPLARIKVEAKKGMRWETNAEQARRLGPRRWEQLQQWRREHHWHPHQLRHTAATQIRRQFGLEAAQIALGHSSALVTEAVYAERDMQKVVEVMQQYG